MKGTAKLPFLGRSAWFDAQTHCADIRRVHAHLRQGTHPSKKLSKIGDIKQYLYHVAIARDGLLVVR